MVFSFVFTYSPFGLDFPASDLDLKVLSLSANFVFLVKDFDLVRAGSPGSMGLSGAIGESSVTSASLGFQLLLLEEDGLDGGDVVLPGASLLAFFLWSHHCS